MDEQQIDWSKLSKKERRKLAKEQKKQREVSQKKQGNIGRWIVIGTVVALVVLGGFWFFRESSKPLPGSLLPDQGRDHVSKASWGKFEYNSNPPTSGPHDAVWIKAGVYDQPQGDGHLVHSLEHGYVVISYRCEAQSAKRKAQNTGTGSAEMDKDCLDFVNKLKERVEKDSWKLILIPRPNLDTNFALTAWRRIDKFKTEEASIERVNNFIDSLRNHGPEQTME